MACRDPEQFAALVGPVCSARGFRGRECREAIRDALRQHGDECLATPLVPGWPPLARYVCPSTDDYIGPLCPTHGRGGAAPGAVSAPTPGRRGHALQTAALATLATGAGVGFIALGVAKSKLNAAQRATGEPNSSQWGSQAGDLANDWMGHAEELLTAKQATGRDALPSDIFSILQADSPVTTKLDMLQRHDNPKVRAFASDPQHTELLNIVAEHRANTGTHNADLRTRYSSFRAVTGLSYGNRNGPS